MRFPCLLLLALAASAQVPSPALLVLNKSEATLVIVDPATGKIAGRVKTGDGPHELAVSPDGRQAFVGNYGDAHSPGNSLSVIDLATQKELRRVDLAPLSRPHGIAVLEGKVWFTAEANKIVARYDPSANRIDTLLGTGQDRTHMVHFTPDGNRMFTANIDGDTISLFERDAAGSNDWKHTVIPVGKGPEGLDLSPNGQELWTAHSKDGGISIIDLAAKKVTGTIDIGTKRSNRLKFTLDGKHVLVSDLTGGELIVIDTASKKQIKRLALGRSPEGILMHPNGMQAFVAVAAENHVAVIDLKTFEPVMKIETGQAPDGMAWVPAKQK